MTEGEFEAVLNAAVLRMNEAAKAGATGYDTDSNFEKTVLAELRLACKGIGNANPSFHDSAFPDIVVNGFGVEVKFTRRGSWHGTGNSIFEGMRDREAGMVYAVYCRSDIPEIRWRCYSDAIIRCTDFSFAPLHD